MPAVLKRLLVAILLLGSAFAQTWQLNTTSVGWQWTNGTTTFTKAFGISLTDTNSLFDDGTNAAVQTKYGDSGSSWINWGIKQSARLTNLNFNFAGFDSYRYAGNFPTGGIPFVASLITSGLATNQYGGYCSSGGPYFLKNLNRVVQGQKCTPVLGSTAEFDPYENGDYVAQTVVSSAINIRLNSCGNWPSYGTRAIMTNVDDGDGLPLTNQIDYHTDGGLVIAENPPYQFTQVGTSGTHTYTDVFVYAKGALRDTLAAEYGCSGSADPASGSYCGSSAAATALTALNTAWGTSYTTWNTSDASGIPHSSSTTYASWGGNGACTANATPYACCTGNNAGSCTRGTGLLDEDGTNIVASCASSAPSDVTWAKNTTIENDIHGFIQVYAGKKAQEYQTGYLAACGSTCPPLAMPMYDAPTYVYTGMQPYVDLFWIGFGVANDNLTLSTVTTRVQNILNATTKPVMVADYMQACPDSYLSSNCSGGTGSNWNLATQAARATQMTTLWNNLHQLKNLQGKYAVVGFEHWMLYDHVNDHTNFGICTGNDNAYDGSQASTLSSASSYLTNHAYTQPAIINDGTNKESLCTAGTSGGSAPSWSTNYYGLTTDSVAARWLNIGSYSLTAESANYGNSLCPIRDWLGTNNNDPAGLTTSTLGSGTGSGTSLFGNGSGSGTGSAGAAVLGVKVTPAVATISSANPVQTLQYSACYYFGDGFSAPQTCIANVPTSATWSSSNTSIATINSSGLASAVSNAVGSANITVNAPDWNGGPNVTSSPAILNVELAPFFTNPATPCTGACPLLGGTVGVAYSFVLTGAGGTSPYTYSCPATCNAPSWVTLPFTTTSNGSGDSNNTIGGTPTSSATTTFTIKICDSVSICNTQSVSITVASSCGPPTYPCTRSDLNAADLPSTVPNVGGLSGANTVVNDDLGNGNRILRCTDANTDSTQLNKEYITSTGSGDDNLWSQSYTRSGHTHYLIIVLNGGGKGYPFDFDSTTYTCSRLYPSLSGGGMTISGGSGSLQGEWAYTSNKLYIQQSNGQLVSYDFTDWVSGPQTTPPTAVNVFNYANATCLGSGYSPTYTSDGGHSGDDQNFMAGFSNSGGQNTGSKVAAYRVGSGCTVLDFSTGVVNGDWGSTGTISSIASNPSAFHNIRAFKSGNWELAACAHKIPSGNCQTGTPYAWQIGTLTTTLLSQTHGSGHFVEGYNTWANMGNYTPGGWTTRLVSNPTSYTDVFTSSQFPSGIALPQDQHSGWTTANSGDTTPWVGSTYQGGAASRTHDAGVLNCSGTTTCAWVSGHQFETTWTSSTSIDIGGTIYTLSGAPTATSLSLTSSGPSGNTVYSVSGFNTAATAWDGIVYAVAPTTGKVSRFTHCMKTGEDAHIFDAAFCIGSVSSDGKYFMFASDWLGTLGCNDGTTSCPSTTKARSDVFIIELR